MAIDPTNPAPPTRDLAASQLVPSPLTLPQRETSGPSPGTICEESSVSQGPPSFGDYDLLHVAGEGGMGIVYQARQRSSGRVIALKVMRLRATGTPDALIRFRREVRIGDLLRHPHIAAANDAGETDGRLYYTMTYAPTNLWRQRRRFSDPQRAARLLVQVARAVHFAHVLGVMHRDLKPSNILLTASDEPLIADFGLARWVDASQDLTESGALLGTTHYMAPEQAAGVPDRLTGSVDVWAMGVILFELLTGQRPFEGDGPDAVLHQVRFAEPPPLRQFRPELDLNLEAIVLRCLRKSPSERFVTAAALADALERWLAGLPARESLPTVQLPGPKQGSSSKRLLAFSTLLAAPALLTYGVLGSSPADPDHATDAKLAVGGQGDRSQRDAITNELLAGNPVTLISQRGWPRYFRNCVEKKGPFVVDCPRDTLLTTVRARNSTSLIELAPQVPCPAYRFECQIRHLKSITLGDRVGVYFGMVNWRAATGEKLCIHCRAIFNDLHDVANLMPGARFPGEPIPVNRLHLEVTLHSIGKSAEAICTYELAVEGGDPTFIPAICIPDSAGKQWRALSIEVQPDVVRVFLDGQNAGQVTTEAIRTASAKLLADAKLSHDVKAMPDMSGPLGLSVTRSVAEFHSAILTPKH